MVTGLIRILYHDQKNIPFRDEGNLLNCSSKSRQMAKVDPELVIQEAYRIKINRIEKEKGDLSIQISSSKRAIAGYQTELAVLEKEWAELNAKWKEHVDANPGTQLRISRGDSAVENSHQSQRKSIVRSPSVTSASGGESEQDALDEKAKATLRVMRDRLKDDDE